MPADESQPGRVGAAADGLFRACDVGHDRVGAERGRQRPGQLVELGDGGERRRRQDDDVGSANGVRRRSRSASSTIPSARACRGPAPDGLQAAIVQAPPIASERARDRAADEPETEQSDPHRPSIGSGRQSPSGHEIEQC